MGQYRDTQKIDQALIKEYQRQCGYPEKQCSRRADHLIRKDIYGQASLHQRGCRLSGKSIFSIFHLFAKLLKKSFQQVMIELKIEQEDAIFFQNDDITVKEVTALLGYTDVLYFSPIYKKYRGYPFRLFRKQLIKLLG